MTIFDELAKLLGGNVEYSYPDSKGALGKFAPPMTAPSMSAGMPPAMPADSPPAGSQVQEPYNFLERFLLSYGGQGEAIKKDKERYALETLGQEYIRTGDKSKLVELAAKNPQGAALLMQMGGDTEYKIVGDQLVELSPGKEPRFIKSPSGNKPLTDVAKLKADLDAGLIDKETYDRRLAKEVAPTEKNYKQFQLTAAGFADRMVNAENILQPYEKLATEGKFEPVNLLSAGLKNIPSFGLGGYLANVNLTDEQQQFRNAAEEWIRAKLRKESGASIPDKEMEQEYRTYFPVPGDSKAVIEQKAKLRKQNTQIMQKQSAGAYDDMYAVVEEEVATPTPKKKRTVKFGELPK